MPAKGSQAKQARPTSCRYASRLNGVRGDSAIGAVTARKITSMDASDPHIHVTAELGTETETRNLLSSTFGLVADRPAVVKTGCGQRVGFAMTAQQPEHVTCLPCREYAAAKHLKTAEQLLETAALTLDPTTVHRAAEHHRALARRYRS